MPFHLSPGRPLLRAAGRVGAMALAWAFALGIALAQEVLPVPALSARVIDQTATLSEPQRAALEAKLAALEQQTGAQLVVLMLPSTAPEDIAAYANRVAATWKIGRREVGDGLLLVVAKNDRRVRIEVARTLEGAIPDLMAFRIIDQHITPAFRAGDYAGGLNAAVDALAALTKGENLPPPEAGRPPGGAPGLQLDELMMFFFIGVPVIGGLLTALMGRKLGSLATAGAAGGIGWWLSASLLAAGIAGLVALLLVGVMGVGAARRGGVGAGPVIWGGGGFGGRGGGGFGGGGFGSGGGGSFGGGGASGGW